MKLITPPGMLVTVALLAIYCAYASWTAFLDRSWAYVLIALISLAASYGTAMLRPWSRYLVYLLTSGFVAAWCFSLYAGARAGFFEFFFASPLEAARSLAPGLFLAVLSLGCSYIVFRHFHR